MIDCITGYLRNSLNPSESSVLENAICCCDLATVKNLLAWTTTLLPNGEIPLHYAIRRANPSIVEAILSTPNIDLLKRDHQNLNALDHAFLKNDPEIVSLVVNYLIDKKYEETKNIAYSIQFKDIVNEIPEKWHDNEGCQLYNLAASNKFQEIQELLTQQPNLELNTQVSPSGCTPLHMAVILNNKEILSLLLAKGAQVNVADHRGLTPLHFAAAYGDMSLIRLLIQNGANPLILTPKGTSPLAMLMSRMKENARKFDSNKIDLGQYLLCASVILQMLKHFYGSGCPIQAILWSYLDLVIPFASSMIMVREYHNHHFSWHSAATLTVLSMLDFCDYKFFKAYSFCGGMSLWKAVKSAHVFCRSVEQMKASWKNRRVDPFRSFGKIAIIFTSYVPFVQQIFPCMEMSKLDRFSVQSPSKIDLSEMNTAKYIFTQILERKNYEAYCGSYLFNSNGDKTGVIRYQTLRASEEIFYSTEKMYAPYNILNNLKTNWTDLVPKIAEWANCTAGLAWQKVDAGT